uniref:aromatase n=1 Tax=Eptatretus burgeri TaxID=7764 RepID=A0A8C4NEG8_EPTBU
MELEQHDESCTVNTLMWTLGYNVLQIIIVLTSFLTIVYSFRTPTKPRISGPSFLLGLGPLLSHGRFVVMGIWRAADYYNSCYGDNVRTWIGGKETFILSSPQAVHKVLKSVWCAERFGSERALKMLHMNNGLIFNNDGWSHLREHFMRAVTGSAVDNTVIAAEQATRNCLAETLRAHPGGATLDVLKLMRCLTLRLSNLLFLHVPINETHLLGVINDYFEAWQVLLIKPSIFFAFRPLYRKYHHAITAPSPLPAPASCSPLPISSADSFHKFFTFWNMLEKMREAVAELVKKKREKLKAGSEERSDFVAGLIQAQELGELTEENVLQCTLEMMIAAPDTMSVTLLFMLRFLAQKPGIQAELVSELETKLGDKARKIETCLGKEQTASEETPSELTSADLQQLSLLDRFIRESIRHMPVVEVIMRKTKMPVALDSCVLPPGSNVVLNLARMHRHPCFPQAHTFSTDNFKEPVPPGHYLPFGAGRRSCVGRHISIIAMKVVLATILPIFQICPADGDKNHPLETTHDLSCHPQQAQPGLIMSFQPRQQGILHGKEKPVG